MTAIEDDRALRIVGDTSSREHRDVQRLLGPVAVLARRFESESASDSDSERWRFVRRALRGAISAFSALQSRLLILLTSMKARLRCARCLIVRPRRFISLAFWFREMSRNLEHSAGRVVTGQDLRVRELVRELQIDREEPFRDIV